MHTLSGADRMAKTDTERGRIPVSFPDDDLCQAVRRSAPNVSRAVTTAQHEILQAVSVFHRRHGHWPTAIKLAVAADAALPLVWGELKILQALGCVEWGKTVRVVREPDGLFLRVVGPKKFTLDTERPFSSEMPRLAPLPHESTFTRGGAPR